MSRLRNKALQDDLLRCMTMIGFSIYIISSDLGLEPRYRTMGVVGIVCMSVALILQILQGWWKKRMTPEEQREAKREASDERSQMIQNKAMRSCWLLEGVLLLIAMIVFLGRNQPEVYHFLYVVLAVRELVCTAIRWWLDRKY